MLVNSIGYLKKDSNSLNADIKKAQIKPYVTHYLNDFSNQSFAKNINYQTIPQNSGSLIGRFINLFV